jgi:hypothetical protein
MVVFRKVFQILQSLIGSNLLGGTNGSGTSITDIIAVKPAAAGRRATSNLSCDLIDKRTEGPLEMRVDC